MRRIPTSALVSPLLAICAIVISSFPASAGGPFFRGGTSWFGMGSLPPSYYGYPLDDMSAGYYGGARYREYYNYGRGYGWANYPGPVPGPLPASQFNFIAITPPKRLPPTAPPPAPPDHSVPRSTTSDKAAYLTVELPADAEVWLEGVKTQQTGVSRLYISPPLSLGNQYAYTIRARWKDEGREVEQSQEVTVHAGVRLIIRFPVGPALETLPPPNRLPPELEK